MRMLNLPNFAALYPGFIIASADKIDAEIGLLIVIDRHAWYSFNFLFREDPRSSTQNTCTQCPSKTEGYYAGTAYNNISNAQSIMVIIDKSDGLKL